MCWRAKSSPDVALNHSHNDNKAACDNSKVCVTTESKALESKVASVSEDVSVSCAFMRNLIDSTRVNVNSLVSDFGTTTVAEVSLVGNTTLEHDT